jgi:hypothetical protein
LSQPVVAGALRRDVPAPLYYSCILLGVGTAGIPTVPGVLNLD